MRIPIATLSLALALAVPPASAQKVEVMPLPDSGVRIGGTAPAAATLSHVCIDATGPAWLVLYSAPANDAALACAKKGMRRVPIAQFDTPATRRWLRGWLKHEIVPQMHVIDAVIEAVRRNPRAPIGLTFEGGMAITYSDYRAAEQRHAAWKADPARYAREQWGR